MKISDWLQQQKDLYTTLSEEPTQVSIHPVSGTWQESNSLKSQYWWGGGATQKSCQQLAQIKDLNNTQMGAISFGPIQSFLGGGQRLRDWAVASWLCHYLAAVLIYRWEELGGKVLLPLHTSVPLVQWLKGELTSNKEKFWQAELPNVMTGIFPDEVGWLAKIEQLIQEEWLRLLKELETASINYNSKLLNGIGWRVIHSNHQYLWTVYAKSTPLQSERIVEDIKKLHESIEEQKIGRNWQKEWWGGRTSPSAGDLSIWHPGLKPIIQGGLWGLPDDTLKEWWESAAQKSRLSGLFSETDRLNSIEMVKRLASIPKIIKPTLERLWNQETPPCPWGTFPDRSAAAASWIPNSEGININRWNETIEDIENYYYANSAKKQRWGMPNVDQSKQEFAHPRALERRNVEDQSRFKDQVEAELWSLLTKGWESPIEWTVGWRGDGDRMGEWLSGKQYQQKNLSWSQWHLTAEIKEKYQLNCEVPNVPNCAKKLDTPHILDLSVLFSHWNQLLYPLTEECHDGKVIFAGGDDFLLLGPLTEAVSLTSDLHNLWTGNPSSLTTPLTPPSDGWVQYQEHIYPVPGQQMSFSLGVVIAQRRIPQSLWHRGLNEAYQQAKNEGRNRICLKILFNSGQSIEWVCPWSLWHLLMSVEPTNDEKTSLNGWEKLLGYLESTHFVTESEPSQVKQLMDTLWRSVGLSLTWEQVEENIVNSGDRRALRKITGYWQWWLNWLSVRAFLARQERERKKWLSLVNLPQEL